jgi:adenylosuccinate lyase
MAIIGSTLDNIATELRNLQRTEIGEVEEEFVRGQKGSSAMPHKRNPIGPENISSQARILRGYAVTALENIVSWHERDLANSANERVILADSAIIVDYCLVRLTGIIKKLTVNEWRMQRNLELTGGMIYSQKVMLALTKKGMAREDAHTLVQNLCWDSHDDPEGPTFKERVYADKRIKKLVTRKQLDQCFDPKQDLKNIPAIFARFQ